MANQSAASSSLSGCTDDVYYFPDGAAFCRIAKLTAYMAASILAANPNCKITEEARAKGLRYVPKGLALGDAPVSKITGASTSSSQNAIVKK